MTLDQYVQQLKKDVEEFEAMWRKNHATRPQEWPLSMGEGDWYEQFLMFESTGNK